MRYVSATAKKVDRYLTDSSKGGRFMKDYSISIALVKRRICDEFC